MAFTENLADFINPDTPGYVDATVRLLPVPGIFDNGFAEIYGMDGAKPSLNCASTDVSTAVRGDAVVVNNINYTIAGIAADGTGMTMITLEKV